MENEAALSNNSIKIDIWKEVAHYSLYVPFYSFGPKWSWRERSCAPASACGWAIGGAMGEKRGLDVQNLGQGQFLSLLRLRSLTCFNLSCICFSSLSCKDLLSNIGLMWRSNEITFIKKQSQRPFIRSSQPYQIQHLLLIIAYKAPYHKMRFIDAIYTLSTKIPL